VAALLVEAEEALARVLLSLAQAADLLAADAPAPPAPDTARPHGASPSRPDGAAAQPLDLRPLLALLRDSDSAAVDWWHAHEDRLARQLSPVLMRQLGSAMNGYDFDAALEALRRHLPNATQPTAAPVLPAADTPP
jgi:hypothetical protein